MSGEHEDPVGTAQQQAEIRAKDDCEHALEQVYAFLDDELDPGSAREIREHLEACEPCVDVYDLEVTVKSLIRRSCGGEIAPAELRQRIVVSMTKVQREVL